MECPDDPHIEGFVRGSLGEAAFADVASHLDQCESCRTLVAELARAEAASHGAWSGDIAHYDLGPELARGGMGRIRAARDLRFSRSVAIKQLLRTSPALRRRFEREVRITARLQHPAIVPIYEAGHLPDGELFYAMRLVEGRAFDAIVAEQRTFTERLALLPALISACDAIAYAHEQGIIHRDLKPGNVLLGAHGETVVIDWGLAKDLRSTEEAAAPGPATDDVDTHTAAGSIVGTLAYMPPEQARGADVDERADVYALGALLYHAIAAVPPYEGQRGEALVREIEAGPPPRLEVRCPDAPRDLCAIVGRAMSREPGDRYADAGEFAADLKRYQNGLLVSAQRYSAWQLALRFVARHRAAVAIGVLGVVLLSAGSAVAVLKLRAQRDRAEALVEFMLGDLRDRLDAVGRLDALEGVADQVEHYYDESGSSLRNVERRAQARLVLGDVRQAESRLADAERIFDEIIALRLTTPQSMLIKASTLHRLAFIEIGRGRLAEAQAHATEAVAIGDELVRSAPSWKSDEVLARALVRLGDTRILQDAPGDALGSYERARAIVVSHVATREDAVLLFVEALSGVSRAESTQGHFAPAGAALDTALAELRVALDRQPGDAKLMRHQVVTDCLSGRLAMRQKHFDVALLRYRDAVTASRILVGREPANTTWHSDLAEGLNGVGVAMSALGQLDEAMESYEERHAVLVALAKRSPDNLDIQRDAAVSADGILDIAAKRGDTARLLPLLETELEALRALSARDPANASWKQDVAVALSNVAEEELAKSAAQAARDAGESVALLRALCAQTPSSVLYLGDLTHALLVEANAEVALRHRDGAKRALDEARTNLASGRMDPADRTQFEADASDVAAKVDAAR